MLGHGLEMLVGTDLGGHLSNICNEEGRGMLLDVVAINALSLCRLHYEKLKTIKEQILQQQASNDGSQQQSGEMLTAAHELEQKNMLETQGQPRCSLVLLICICICSVLLRMPLLCTPRRLK